MSVSRTFAALTCVALAAAAAAISFAGAASGASAPAIPSAIVSVHADPGHVSTRFVGMSCGGSLTVEAIGTGGGSGKVACGRTRLSVAASPDGTFDSTFAPAAQGPLVCQANAVFASSGVDVICTENVD